MAALPESSTYEQNIYQLETVDPVLGGANGVSNRQAKQLANRTKWLKDRTDSLGDGIDNINNFGAFVPVGATLFVIGSAAPVGYLKMNGATVSRTAYAALWAYAQNALAPNNDTANNPGLFGVGDGATTFQLPDTRGWFPRFWADGSSVDTDAARLAGSAQADHVGAHQHGIFATKVEYSAIAGTADMVEENAANSLGYRLTQQSSTFATTNPADQASGQNVVKNIALLGVIKY
jgi:microcystin-dependent protein